MMSEKKENEKIICPCGSIIKNSKYLNRHNKSKKHIYFLENGELRRPDNKEYQRKRLSSNPELRNKQRQLCKDYYEKNKTVIQQRHQKYREDRKKTKLELKKNCECNCNCHSSQTIS